MVTERIKPKGSGAAERDLGEPQPLTITLRTIPREECQRLNSLVSDPDIKQAVQVLAGGHVAQLVIVGRQVKGKSAPTDIKLEVSGATIKIEVPLVEAKGKPTNSERPALVALVKKHIFKGALLAVARQGLLDHLIGEQLSDQKLGLIDNLVQLSLGMATKPQRNQYREALSYAALAYKDLYQEDLKRGLNDLASKPLVLPDQESERFPWLQRQIRSAADCAATAFILGQDGQGNQILHTRIKQIEGVLEDYYARWLFGRSLGESVEQEAKQAIAPLNTFLDILRASGYRKPIPRFLTPEARASDLINQQTNIASEIARAATPQIPQAPSHIQIEQRVSALAARIERLSALHNTDAEIREMATGHSNPVAIVEAIIEYINTLPEAIKAADARSINFDLEGLQSMLVSFALLRFSSNQEGQDCYSFIAMGRSSQAGLKGVTPSFDDRATAASRYLSFLELIEALERQCASDCISIIATHRESLLDRSIGALIVALSLYERGMGQAIQKETQSSGYDLSVVYSDLENFERVLGVIVLLGSDHSRTLWLRDQVTSSIKGIRLAVEGLDISRLPDAKLAQHLDRFTKPIADSRLSSAVAELRDRIDQRLLAHLDDLASSSQQEIPRLEGQESLKPLVEYAAKVLAVVSNVSNQELNNQLAQAIDSAIDRMINDIHDWCVLEIERLAEKDQCQQVDLRRALSAVYRLEVEYKFIQQELKDFAQHLSPNLLSKVETHLQHVPSLLGLKIKRNNPALSGLIEELNRDAASKDLGVTAEANWSLAILRRLRLVTRNTLNTKLSKQSKQA